MTTLNLPQKPALLSPRGWAVFIGVLLVLGVLVPVLNLYVPAGHALHVSDFAVSLVGKIMCYAICALAMDLIWGYTGILSLGHGLFFALSYIVDAFMVMVLGGVGQLAGTVYAALGLGVLNKFLEGWAGAVLAKIAVLVFIIVFIQKRPQGLFAMKGRSAEA